MSSNNVDYNDPSSLLLCVMDCFNKYLITANGSLRPYALATTGTVGLVRDFGNAKSQSHFPAQDVFQTMGRHGRRNSYCVIDDHMFH